MFKDILDMLVTFRRLLEDEVIKLMLQVLHLPSEVAEHGFLERVEGLLEGRD